MRVLLWHGWLLSGSGSNVYTARVAEVLRREGHEVVLMCQEREPDRLAFVDGWGDVGVDGVSDVRDTGAPPAAGRCILLRPRIGTLLPVFVLDEYEGFTVKRFVDLTDEELEGYLARNVAALAAVTEAAPPDAVVAGHAVPGGPVAGRALGPGRYSVKVHGSDVEYAMRVDRRYVRLAREGLDGATAVLGTGTDVLRRLAELVPGLDGRLRVVPPGVDVTRFRPRPRGEALGRAAALLEADPATARGRPEGRDDEVRRLLGRRDGAGLDALAASYDQDVPDPGAPARLRRLARTRRPLAGYLGKLIPQKGVERLIEALALVPEADGLVVGFGSFRERLAALVVALDRGDAGAHGWLGEGEMRLELGPPEVAAARSLAARVAFTGRLDHRYAPLALAALDVLVVPSILAEAFGMVAAEGAAAGALPLVARHSGLAEVAGALEGALGRPGLLSFEPGPGATRALADGLRRLLSLPAAERLALRTAVSEFVSSRWTWERTAAGILAAASPGPGD